MKNPLSSLTPAGKIILLLILVLGLFFVYQSVMSPQGLSQDLPSDQSTGTGIPEDTRTMIQKINDLDRLSEEIYVEGTVLYINHLEGFGDIGFLGDKQSAIFFKAEYNSLDFSVGDLVKLEGTVGIFSATPWAEEKVFIQLSVSNAETITKNQGVTAPEQGTSSEVNLENRGKRILLKEQKPVNISERYGGYIVDFGDYRAIFTTEVYDNPSIEDVYEIQGFVYVLDEPYLRALKVDKT
ncbi:MAG: hypothetical protein GOU97_03255 [Nanoarchaeota archaeon]|nr:hypothetical protein [Nanoarchaeota archaeon]